MSRFLRACGLGVAGLLLPSLACVTTEEVSAEARGEALFSDPQFATESTANRFSCATCHATTQVPDPRTKILTGAPLAGVTARPSYWGGAETDLRTSVDHCRNFFMGAPTPLVRDAEETRALYAYLLSLPPTTTTAVPFTVVRATADLPAPQASTIDGAQIYKAACASCHGATHTGAGRDPKTAPILPEETVAEHTYLGSATATREVFIEKVRHGGFLGYGGTMPPFSREALSDDELAALLAYLNLYK